MTTDFEIIGEWFSPSDKEKRVSGTLNYSASDTITLELYGSLGDRQDLLDFTDFSILHGLSNDSKQITLYHCFRTGSSGSLFSNDEYGKPIIFYKIKFLFIGIHIHKEEDLKFDNFTSEIHNLGEWLGISGFKNKLTGTDKDDFDISIQYKFPTPIEFKIDEIANGYFTFKLEGPSRYRYQKSYSIEQKVMFGIGFKEEISIEKLLSYLFRFQNFLALALYENTYPISITLSNKRFYNKFDNTAILKQVELYFSNSNKIHNSNTSSGIEFLFNFGRIKERFPLIMLNWFEKYDLLEPAFNLVFEQFNHQNTFNVNNFLNLAQSAETFHARTHNHTKIPRLEYNSMKTEILDLVPSKYHSWLIDQFKFGNNLNLHSRISEIINEYSNEFIDKLIGDKELFIRQIKHSRNYYTHYSSNSKKNALKGSALFYLSEKLKILLVCSFLMVVGFEKEELEKFLDGMKWKFSSHF